MAPFQHLIINKYSLHHALAESAYKIASTHPIHGYALHLEVGFDLIGICTIPFAFC